MLLLNLWCNLVCKNFSIPIEVLLYFSDMNCMFGNNVNNYEEYEEYSNSCQEDCEISFKPFLNVSIVHNPFNLCKIFTIFNFFNDYKYDCKVLSRICYNYAYVQLIQNTDLKILGQDEHTWYCGSNTMIILFFVICK